MFLRINKHFNHYDNRDYLNYYDYKKNEYIYIAIYKIFFKNGKKKEATHSARSIVVISLAESR